MGMCVLFLQKFSGVTRVEELHLARCDSAKVDLTRFNRRRCGSKETASRKLVATAGRRNQHGKTVEWKALQRSWTNAYLWMCICVSYINMYLSFCGLYSFVWYRSSPSSGWRYLPYRSNTLQSISPGLTFKYNRYLYNIYALVYFFLPIVTNCVRRA